jgi:hypothetical protein
MPSPTWLIDLTTAATEVSATGAFQEEVFQSEVFDTEGGTILLLPARFRFATRDLDALSQPYLGRLLDRPTINRALTDTFWGVAEITEISFKLANARGDLNVLVSEDVRGQPIVFQRYDVETEEVAETISAVISQVQQDVGALTIQATSPDLTPFEQLMPSTVIQGDNMSDAAGVTLAHLGRQIVDGGAVIPVVFGQARKIPLAYIRDGVNQNHYDYMVCHGERRVDAVYRNGASDGTFTLVKPHEYDVSWTRYRGFTTIRFRVRQMNFQNTFYKIYADVSDPAALPSSPLVDNATLVHGTVTAVDPHEPFPLNSLDCPRATISVTSKDPIAPFADLAPEPPFTLDVWLSPDVGLPSVGQSLDWAIEEVGGDRLSAWVGVPFPSRLLVTDPAGENTRNFAVAVKQVLTDPTWGLGQQIDQASFDQAQTDLDAVGSLYCEGAMIEQRKAQDVLAELLSVRGMRLAVNSAGKWTLTVDTLATGVSLELGDGLGNGLRNVLRAGSKGRPNSRDAVTDYVVQYRPDYTKGNTYLFNQHRTVSPFGKPRTATFNFIRNHVTADKVADYVGKRLFFGQSTVEIITGQAGRGVAVGDLILFTYPPLDYAAAILEVTNYRKAIEQVQLTAAAWDESIYDYDPGTLPIDLEEELLTAVIPRPGGLELLGPSSQPVTAGGIATENLVGQANGDVWTGKDVRFRWHSIAVLPHRGLDEDNLDLGNTLIRDYLVTIFGIIPIRALSDNATNITATVLVVGHAPFPLTGTDLPTVTLHITAKSIVETLFDFVPDVPVDLLVFVDPALALPAVGATVNWMIELDGNSLTNAWVKLPFPVALLPVGAQAP